MLVTGFHTKFWLYRIVCSTFQLVDTGIMHPVRERAKRALLESVDYIDQHMDDAVGLEAQRDIIIYSLNHAPTEGYILEFGVFRGGTIRFIAKNMRSRRIDGFDSFEGLPEVWGGFNLGKSAFSREGKLPKVPHNVILHKGWFDKTIPAWAEANHGPIAFMHIDCDIYSSTKTILEELSSRISKGTIILFDEYFNYPGWKIHEYKAFREFVEKYQVKYKYLAYARQQVAVRIDSITH